MLLSLLSLPDLSGLGIQLSNAINIILEFIQHGSESSDLINSTIGPALIKLSETFSIFTSILLLIIGFVGCFFGFKLSRLFMTITGFLTGLCLGGLVGVRFLHASNGIVILCILAGGVLLSIFSYRIYRAGIFVLSFCLAFVGLANYMTLTGNLAFFLCTLGGFLMGSLALKFVKPVLILASAFVCGHMASEALIQIGPKLNISFFSQDYAGLILFAILFIAGSLVQFLTNQESEKKRKKKK